MKLKSPQNKWFIPFMIATVIAIAAIVVAVIMGMPAEKPQDVEYTEGAEVGVYYYDVVDGEVLLTLSGGNRFTIAGPTTNKTGTYTVDGTNITLDFFKDEDGTTTATINGDTIALLYDGATMSFQKRIQYTVTFAVNGGTQISAVSVINGKTVAQPADPVKENSVFLGWYADEALTTPFDFGATTVKSNMTIYARWAEKQPGKSEFTVDFDLCYEGAEKLAPITTIAGVAYDIPTPQREGYTFGGWWISMYEDGQKLTYAYTEDAVFTADCTLYAVWHENAGSKLQAPAVSVTANAISWDGVKGASSYKLTVVDPDGNLLLDNETVGGTVRAFDFGTLKAGEYQISVVAVAGSQENNSDPAVRYFANKALDRVSGLTVIDGILIFNGVEYAQKYTITIDCGNESHVHTNFDNGTSTTFYMANCPMQEGGILVTVTASASGYASSTSKVFVYNKVLDRVEHMEYDARNDQFVWSPVANTVAYLVTISVDGKDYTFNNGTSTTFSVAGFSGDITCFVVPATEGYNSPLPMEASCKKTAPAAPGGLTANGMILSWNPVEGAVSYEVSIDGQNIPVEGTELNMAEASVSLAQGQLYAVKVKAINANNESSSYSEVVEMGYFGMNPVMTYAHNTVYWSPVLGVSQYQVRVNAGPVYNVTNGTSAKVVLTKEGENIIEVRYVNGEETSEWTALSVTAFAVEYDTRSVASGSFFIEYLAVGDEMSLPTEGFSYPGYKFTGWYNAPKGAAGNGKQYREGAIFNGNAYTVVYAEWQPEDFYVILNTDGYSVSNIENGQQETVTYTKHFVLPVPEAKNTGIYVFSGWYTSPNGGGVQVTDKDGVSIAPYSFTREITLYPYYSTDVVRFIIQSDGTYGVYRGESIKGVTHLEIPAFYKDVAVTKILESAFNHVDCDDLVSIRIPDTITLIGASAFSACDNLESIEVYKGKEGNYETYYSSENGVLLREDMGTTYLEMVPRAKKGDFIIPDSVDIIFTRAFYFTQITSVTIPNNVVGIPKYAFYKCPNLKTVTFETGRTNDIEIGDYAFYLCDAVETMALPANFNIALEDMTAILDMISSLKAITVENGGTTYASVGGMLTNAAKNTILYCPKAYAGAVSIPNGISAIGDKAFYERKNITAITVPIWLKSIGVSAFEGCSKVSEILIKGSRSDDLSIGNYAFRSCINVETITFEGNDSDELDTGVITIGTGAFSNYSNKAVGRSRLTTVTIGEGVNIATIGNQAFYYQNKLREFVIDPKAVVGTIGEYAFDHCERLVSFDVPASVTKIGQYAFSGCTTLAAVNFRTEGATSLQIDAFAFNGCTKLGQVLLPDHLTEFKAAAFEGCDALKAILVTETNPLYLNDANGILYKRNADKSLTELLFYPKGLARDLGGVVNNLPAELITIGGSAFSANKYLVSITIPKNVTCIDISAFANCENLKTVNFAADGTSITIGSKAFQGCISLENFQLPSYTTRIGTNAFENCEFTSFVVPANVTVIETAAFKNCKNLEDLRFDTAGSLTISVGGAQGTGTFTGCTALKTVNLPKGLTELGKYAFYQCTGLETVTFGNTVKNADGTYTTDSNLTTISGYAFYQCTGLKTIIIPKSVTTIGAYVFAATEADPGTLENVIFERFGNQKLTVANYAFAYQQKLQKITFPARLTHLYDTSVKYDSTSSLNFINVFQANISLAEINIDNDVVSGISKYFSSIDGVLYNGSKTAVLFCPAANVGRYVNGQPTYELIIPNTVRTVMTHAFRNNTQLKTITFEEFQKGSENYGQPLLTIGNYVYTHAQIVSVRNQYTGSAGYTLSAIGGDQGSSITTINLPSHLAKINCGAFASKSENPVNLTFNADIDQLELPNFAFVHCRAIAVEIPGTLKSIGENAFRESIYLQHASFNLPAGTTKLPDNLFHGCVSLENFPIPTQIKEIPQYAFYNCKALKSIELPQGLNKLGNSCFSSAGLETISIPAGITKDGLGNNVFSGCQSLHTVVFEKGASGKSSLTWIGQGMFSNCRELQNVNFEDMNLEVIHNSAFTDCKKLQNVDFTKMTKLYYIGTMAFARTALVNVDLSKTVVTDIYNSFSNLPSMETFVFPNSVKSVATNVFLNSTGLKSVTLSSNFTGAFLAKFVGLAADITVPSNNKNLAQDSFGAIYDPNYQSLYYVGGYNKDLTGYVMPESVIAISDYAFAYVKADHLILPEGVKTIGTYAFYYSQIPTITIPSTVETIGQYAFKYAGVEQVLFANEHNSKLKSIGTCAFEFSKIRSIVLPDNLDFKATDRDIFKDCYELKSITLGAKVRIIPATFIRNCYALEELLMQEGVETINNLFTFYNSVSPGVGTSVKNLVIPSTVKTLFDGAFASFEKLETVTFANNSQLESIGQGAFVNCYNLKSINVPASVKTMGKQAFRNCRSLEAIDLAATAIELIDEYSFENTNSLAVLALPNTLKTIGQYAFRNTGVVDLVIPAAVMNFGDRAFENAAAMKTLTFAPDSMIETLGSDETESSVFKGTTSLQTVTLPNFLKVIGNNAFENSGVRQVLMTDVTMPADLQYIGSFAFANCGNLESFDYLNRAHTIGESAFLCCSSLTSAPVSETLDYLGAMAFGFCQKLSAVTIPASVTELGGNPFAGMEASKITLAPENTFFTAVTDANGVLTIYDAAQSIIYGVYGATGEYQVDKDATMMMAGALAGNQITNVSFPLRLIVDGDYMFMNCTSLVNAVLPEEMDSIGRYAFYQTAVTTIDIPATVTTIGDYAFAYCAVLNNVTIPASVNTFGSYCFAYCAALSDFTFEESTALKTMGTHFFYNCPNITEVILPARFSTTAQDALNNGQMSHNIQGVIPSYTFAGTGIVIARIPAFSTLFYATGVFENCQNLEQIILLGTPTQASAMYLLGPNWVAGCDKLERVVVDNMDNIFVYVVEWADKSGFTELYIAKIDLEKVTAFNLNARFYQASEEFCLYFEGNSYQELIPLFEPVTNAWTMKIYDKDGNQLICSQQNGAVVCVKDAQGNIIWEATEEE